MPAPPRGGAKAPPLLQQGYFHHVHDLVFVQLHAYSCRSRQDQLVSDDVSVDVSGRSRVTLELKKRVIVRRRGSASGRVGTIVEVKGPSQEKSSPALHAGLAGVI